MQCDVCGKPLCSYCLECLECPGQGHAAYCKRPSNYVDAWNYITENELFLKVRLPLKKVDCLERKNK